MDNKTVVSGENITYTPYTTMEMYIGVYVHKVKSLDEGIKPMEIYDNSLQRWLISITMIMSIIMLT